MMRPPTMPELSGGDFALFIVSMLAILVAGLALRGILAWREQRAKQQAEIALLQKIQTITRREVNALSTDILAAEDEIQLSSSKQALTHYRRATATYADLVDAMDSANTIRDYTDLADMLDTAIWHLDAAEAALDGKPQPEPPPPKSDPRPQGLQRRPGRTTRRRTTSVASLVATLQHPQLPPLRKPAGPRDRRTPRRHC
jgi:hypothetical protein